MFSENIDNFNFIKSKKYNAIVSNVKFGVSQNNSNQHFDYIDFELSVYFGDKKIPEKFYDSMYSIISSEKHMADYTTFLVQYYSNYKISGQCVNFNCHIQYCASLKGNKCLTELFNSIKECKIYECFVEFENIYRKNDHLIIHFN